MKIVSCEKYLRERATFYKAHGSRKILAGTRVRVLLSIVNFSVQRREHGP